MKNKKYYLLNSSLYNLRQMGFYYSVNDEGYVLLFPIFKYNKKPTLFCKLVYNKLDNIAMYDIIKPNSEWLGIYYNHEFGYAKNYIKKIDSIVDRKMKAMGFKKKKKHVNKTEKEKND